MLAIKAVLPVSYPRQGLLGDGGPALLEGVKGRVCPFARHQGLAVQLHRTAQWS